MGDFDNNTETRKLLILIIPAILSIIIAAFQLGIGFGFWLILILWIIIFIVYFLQLFIFTTQILLIAVSIIFIFSTIISFKIISLGGTAQTSNANTTKNSEGITISDCTSTINDSPVMLSGWKSTIYSAPLLTNSPNPDQTNNVRSFSHNGIKNKTESNSLYVRIEKADGSYITGYGTTMEACSDDNKTSFSYTTADTDHIASENTVASVHYLHGGRYLHETGNYRVDIYIKDTNNKWHLVDRMTDITITE